MKRTRVMDIESKAQNELVGPARIGLVTFSKTGRSIWYNGRRYVPLGGRGFKANYRDVETGEHYWISGCKKDGSDALYSTDVEVDDDVLDEYWIGIRKRPDQRTVRRYRCKGIYGSLTQA